MKGWKRKIGSLGLIFSWGWGTGVYASTPFPLSGLAQVDPLPSLPVPTDGTNPIEPVRPINPSYFPMCVPPLFEPPQISLSFPTMAQSLHAIALEYAQLGEFDRAEAIAAEIPSNITGSDPEVDRLGNGMSANLQAKALAEIADVAIAAGQRDRGLTLLKRAESLINGASEPDLESIAVALMRAGQRDRARTLIQTYTEADRRANVIERVAVRLAETGSIEAALAFVTPQEAGRKVWFAIPRYYLDARQFERALAVPNLISDFCLRVEVQREISQSLLEANQPDLALQMAQTIEDRSLQVETLLAIADWHLARGESQPALAILSSLLNAPDRIGTDDLVRIAAHLISAGETPRTRELLQSIESSRDRNLNYLPPSDSTVGDLAVQWARLGDFERALRLTQGIEPQDIRARALLDLARLRADTGQNDEAIALLDLAFPLVQTAFVPDEYLDFSQVSLASFVVTLAKAGEFERALAFANTLEHSRSRVLQALGMALVAAERYPEAIQVARSPRTDTLQIWGRIAFAYTRSGREDEAKQRLSELEPDQSAGALGYLAGFLLDAGDIDRAIDVAVQMGETWTQPSLLLNIADAALENDLPDLAISALDKALPAVRAIANYSRNPFYNADILLADIAQRYRRLGQTQRASDLLQEAYTLAKKRDRASPSLQWEIYRN